MRAWMCHGANQAEMVGKLAQAGIVKSPINKAALLAVDRGNYVRGNREYAYEDSPAPIGYGQTISAPVRLVWNCSTFDASLVNAPTRLTIAFVATAHARALPRGRASSIAQCIEGASGQAAEHT